ncbi:hypothetical protein HOD05_02300 [Candidatus Woesearchaeota archaeon]|mgnify:FL=1|jgi:hypothetical protein|nr:hypothetical protein [Candidatus Woesearchaeota archaeon]MBT4150584.1 hypothetical protein [Candidatus Woesearchaeota archaeon]MBT4247693.1 hypothetical protein [Candidatus Woesearchaeota archaeon]MBT4434027.1 hypothetical protein [Candidatus Woesearchaeota archaeon]MBT7331978.1 hypothetical protein [Candidatus Woesearchaeota archaeon]
MDYFSKQFKSPSSQVEEIICLNNYLNERETLNSRIFSSVSEERLRLIENDKRRILRSYDVRVPSEEVESLRGLLVSENSHLIVGFAENELSLDQHLLERGYHQI